jgi:hypothetical protein
MTAEEQRLMNYNVEQERFTLNQDGTRFVLQNVSNYGLQDMPKIINILSKERFDVIMLSLPPLNDEDQSLLIDNSDV